MKNLEARQKEMRARNAARPTSETKRVSLPDSSNFGENEVVRLRKRVSDLERQVLLLEEENRKLHNLKKIVVERAPERSHDDSVREQQHNFFKYSNVRRY